MADAARAPPPPADGSRADRHTFGPQCRLAPVPPPPADAGLEGIPPLRAQFFYASLVPIDDPLSAGTGDAKSPKPPLRPFSPGDNNVLDKAWLGLSSDTHRDAHAAARLNRSPSAAVVQSNDATLAVVVRHLVARHRLKHAHEEAPAADAVKTVRVTLQGAATSMPVCCEQLPADAASELAALFCPLAVARQAALSADKVVQRVMVSLGRRTRSTASAPDSHVVPASVPPHSVASSAASKHDLPSARRFEPLSSSAGASRAGPAQPVTAPETAPPPDGPPAGPTAAPLPSRLPGLDDGISGQPFLRVDRSDTGMSTPVVAGGPSLFLPSPSSSPQPSAAPCRASQDGGGGSGGSGGGGCSGGSGGEAGDNDDDSSVQEELQTTSRLLDALRASAKVAVGIARLHTVDLPALQMKPIYWSPVHDVSMVQRSTWFYRDTMMPVEAAVANQLEALYHELCPWSETWAIELRCAIDLGAVGEEKVSHPLWPSNPPQRRQRLRPGTAPPPVPALSRNPVCAARCHHGAAAAEGSLELPSPLPSATPSPPPPAPPPPPPPSPPLPAAGRAADEAAAARSFANYHVAFRDGTTAFLLKPSLKPSAYYGRRPISKISKGVTVGIPVVRGFDRDAWSRIHERGPRSSAAAGGQWPAVRPAEGPGPGPGPTGCPGCEAENEALQFSDLVLVIHGVGQKLAERVESFHFTHAVNGLRRAMNVELKKPVVRSVLREQQHGIMVLPVNWRHTLSFEEGGFSEDGRPGHQASAADGFGLKDIEPSTIPAVRSMISDVMFDIPFYMSHHKPKMIQSLVREANRVYRLWCQNNPGFAEHGRVHLIGHSLGSAMAIEALSKQPTALPPLPALDPSRPLSAAGLFEFDTKNLFLLGSPAAFFLLLERGALVPRRGRRKPGVDANDSLDDRVVGEAGAFGCLAVDNIYNVLAKEDPIAYLLNGTIDTAYATSLKTAYVPSATAGFFAAIGHSLRGVVPGAATTPHPSETSLAMPPPPAPVVRLPSQLELEVHDFTREEVAERKAHLLNDNGQIDYFLRSGGGPLEIQYLNMLSAHTSYWTNQDLVRMLCVEIGRRPGKQHTLPTMRAAKPQKRIVPAAGQA